MNHPLTVYRRLLPLMRPHVLLLAVGASLAVVVAAMDGTIAWLVKPAMDDIFIRQDQAMLRLIPLLLFGAYVVKGFARYGQSYLMASVGERVIARLRATLYTHIQRMPLSFFADLHSAELMSRVISDVGRLSRVSSTALVMVIRQVAMVLALGTVMIAREWRLTLIALLAVPFIALAVRLIGRRLYRINKRAQEKIAELNVMLHEAFSGMKIVKAFGRETHERERFERVNRRLLDLALKDHRADEITEPAMEIIAAFGIMAAIWYGGHQVIAGTKTPGDFFSFTAALALLYGPIRQLSRLAVPPRVQGERPAAALPRRHQHFATFRGEHPDGRGIDLWEVDPLHASGEQGHARTARAAGGSHLRQARPQRRRRDVGHQLLELGQPGREERRQPQRVEEPAQAALHVEQLEEGRGAKPRGIWKERED